MFCSKLVNGSVLRINETLRNPALADSLSLIAKNGDRAFYNGSVGRMLVKDIEVNGGIITMEDVQDYYVDVTEALRRTLRDNVSVFVPPAPSGGPLLAFMIALMDSYRQQRPGGSGFSLDDSEETIHRFVEAIKFTYAKRMEIGDPGHIDMRNVLEQLASESFLADVRSKIRGTPFRDMRYYGVRYQKIESHGSGQIVILMPDGDALALMGSINGPLGALALSPSTGILLNNEMNDFAIPGVKNAFGLLPSHVNYIRPGKRPTSSISPLVMTDAQGDVTMVVSGTGAFSIITGAAQVVMRALWMNHTIKEAIDAPRVHHQLFPDEVLAEPNLDVVIRDAK
ncbi:scoloptoxin SSD20-like [Ixodes scapularis]